MGGHEMAVGLSLNRNNYEEFKKYFEKIAEEKDVRKLVPVIKIDGEITKENLNIGQIKELEKLEPFGEKNKNPIFLYKNLKIDSIRALSEGKHLKLGLRDENIIVNAIGFNLGHLAEEYLIGDKIDVVGSLEINRYNGADFIQINLKDIMKSV